MQLLQCQRLQQGVGTAAIPLLCDPVQTHQPHMVTAAFVAKEWSPSADGYPTSLFISAYSKGTRSGQNGNASRFPQGSVIRVILIA